MERVLAQEHNLAEIPYVDIDSDCPPGRSWSSEHLQILMMLKDIRCLGWVRHLTVPKGTNTQD